MRGHHRAITGSLVVMAAALVTEPGCTTPARRSLVGSSTSPQGEPPLNADVAGSEVAVVEPNGSNSVNTAKSVSFVDRHPLLRKPQQYYDNTKSNKVVKTAAAAVVGVPAGLVGEIKQIVIGAPAATPAPAY